MRFERKRVHNYEKVVTNYQINIERMMAAVRVIFVKIFVVDRVRLVSDIN